MMLDKKKFVEEKVDKRIKRKVIAYYFFFVPLISHMKEYILEYDVRKKNIT